MRRIIDHLKTYWLLYVWAGVSLGSCVGIVIWELVPRSHDILGFLLVFAVTILGAAALIGMAEENMKAEEVYRKCREEERKLREDAYKAVIELAERKRKEDE